MITGKTLLELGYQPAKWFGEVLKHANANRLEKQALIAYIESVKPKLIPPFKEPLAYHKNIRAESEAEESNLKQVFKTMDVVMKTPTIVKGAIMPDACPAGSIGQIPVGGVVAAKNAIHPAMHSADICCSVMMTNLGKIEPKTVLDTAHKTTHFGGGGRKDLFNLPSKLEEQIQANPLLKTERSLNFAKTHLGTQGDGNHFLFVGRSEMTGETIMVTHHGSRGFGANLYKEGMKLAEYFRKEISPATLEANAWIPFDTEQGKHYWEALQIVRTWTKLNHAVIHKTTFQELDLEPLNQFWNEHNFIFKDADFFYHAKGATPLDDKYVPDSKDGLRLIPLNMSQPVLIVKGETTSNNLGFAPHGAGRNISRRQHKRNNANRSIIDLFGEETQNLDVRFYSNHIDISELPSAYKNAAHLQRQMREFNLGNIVDRILPYGCIMAGEWDRDAPWKVKARQKWQKRKNSSKPNSRNR